MARLLGPGPGHPPADADVDGVEALLACHGRIREFLALAATIATAAQPPPAEVARAAERVRRYFTEALPLHVEDEERSLLPRLQGREPALDAALGEMSRQHADHEPARRALLATCQELIAHPERHAALAARLSQETRVLAAALEPHLQAEEALVFPAAHRLLDPTERRAILTEVRARRSP